MKEIDDDNATRGNVYTIHATQIHTYKHIEHDTRLTFKHLTYISRKCAATKELERTMPNLGGPSQEKR